jgi:uncharacterized protein YigA (DUF484 family)
VEGILDGRQAHKRWGTAAGEIKALKAALERAREHNRHLEGSVSRLVEENVMIRRQLQMACATLAEAAEKLTDLALACVRVSAYRMGRPVVGYGPAEPAAPPATPD